MSLSREEILAKARAAREARTPEQEAAHRAAAADADEKAAAEIEPAMRRWRELKAAVTGSADATIKEVELHLTRLLGVNIQALGEMDSVEVERYLHAAAKMRAAAQLPPVGGPPAGRTEQ